MSYQAEREFDLIIEAVPVSSSRDREELARILSAQCGFTLLEIPELLERGPLVVMQAAKAEDLNALRDSISKTGATVSIVRRKADTSTQINPEMQISFHDFFSKYVSGLQKVLTALDPFELEAFVNDLLIARRTQRQIFFIGNGGSAASASHFANDFSKVRFDDEKLLFRVMSLNDNTSWLSAIANDFGYDCIFEHQLKNLLQPGDIVVAISSSGNSANIMRAIEYANTKGAVTYGIVGFDGGKLRDRAQKTIYIPTKKGQYGFMEDATLVIGHIVSVYLFENDLHRQQ